MGMNLWVHQIVEISIALFFNNINLLGISTNDYIIYGMYEEKRGIKWGIGTISYWETSKAPSRVKTILEANYMIRRNMW